MSIASTASVAVTLLAPLFLWCAPDVTSKELTDFVGRKTG
jgi:hypothetical protein